MPFDMGFNFRSTAGYVTDGSEGVPALGEAYPHTYTNSNGYSINAGWSVSGNVTNRSSTNDPRLAGVHYTTEQQTFTVDLSSGSAPGAGDYSVDFAIGDASAGDVHYSRVYDDSTTLITAAGVDTTVAGKFFDATLSLITASTTWTGTPSTKTFATTTAKFVTNYAAQGYWNKLAHFRLTLQSSQSVVPVLMSQYRQRRG